MRRLRLAPVGVAAAALVLLSGCVTGGQPDAEEQGDKPENLTGPIEVVSFYPQGSADYERLEGLAEKFEKKYPGSEVKLVFGGGQDTPKIQARWRAGNPPEVNFGFFDGQSPEGTKYAQAGQVHPLDELMREELAGYEGKPWREAILPAVHPFLVNPRDGRYYAAPDAVTTIQFFYNKKIFSEHGIQPPKTFDELVAAADKLKSAGVAPFAVTGTFGGYMQMYYDYLLMRHTGAANVTGAINGTRDFASLPGVDQAAADLERLVSSGYFLEGFESTDFTAAQLNFFQGRSAMILMGSWLLGEMKDSIPDDFEIGTFPFPTVPGAKGEQGGVLGTVNVLSVAKQSKNPRLGAEWVRFLAEKPNQTAMVEQTGNISAYAGVPAPEGFGDQAALLDKKDGLIPSYYGVYGVGTPQKVRDAVQQPIQRMFFGEIGAEEMVAEIDKRLRDATAA